MESGRADGDGGMAQKQADEPEDIELGSAEVSIDPGSVNRRRRKTRHEAEVGHH